MHITKVAVQRRSDYGMLFKADAGSLSTFIKYMFSLEWMPRSPVSDELNNQIFEKYCYFVEFFCASPKCVQYFSSPILLLFQNNRFCPYLAYHCSYMKSELPLQMTNTSAEKTKLKWYKQLFQAKLTQLMKYLE